MSSIDPALSPLADLSDFRSTIAAAIAPRPPVDRVEWVRENVFIPKENSPSAGAFDFDRHPYAAEPIAAMDDPSIREIVLCWATQAGKGDTTWAMLASQAHIDPKSVLYCGPDQDYVTEQRDRFLRILADSPLLAPLCPKKHELNIRTFTIGGMRIYWAWSGSVQKLSGRSTPLIIASEASHWQRLANDSHGLQLIRNRVKAWVDQGYLIVCEGTPTDELCPLWERFEAGDQRRFFVPCPHCGKFQMLRHWTLKEGELAGKGGLAGWQDEHGNPKEPERCLDEAYYLCMGGCRIDEEHRRGMLVRGVWAPRGCVVDRLGIVQGQIPNKRVRSYHLNSLYAASLSFGENAAEMVAGLNDPESRRNFVNNWEARPWVVKARALKAEVFAAEHTCPGHKRGRVPPESVFLTAAADIQSSQVFWSVDAWGDRCTSWRVDWGVIGVYEPGLDDEDEIKARIAQNLEDLDEVLDRHWPIDGFDPLGFSDRQIALMLVDANYHGATVAEFVRRQALDGRGKERVRMVRGRSGRQKQGLNAPWTRQAFDRDADSGRNDKHGLSIWSLDVATYKDDLQGVRWSTERGRPGAWYLPEDVLPGGLEFIRQVTNEARIVERRKADNRLVASWRIIDGRIGNHWWDCEVYNRIAADMRTGCRWNLQREVERVLQRRQAPQRGLPGDFSAR